MAEDLKVGDVVVIKTIMHVSDRKPVMVIEKFVTNETVECIWYAPSLHEYKKQIFNIQSLEKSK
jgi:uncharacterized protein YodC (DUF2158 family)